MVWTLTSRRTLTLLAALLLCACSKDDDRALEDADASELAPDAAPRCQVDERTLGLDDATPIGATANDLFRWIAGVHTEPLLWLSDASASDTFAPLDGFGPEQGSSQLQLEFEPIGARLLTRTALDDASVGLCPTSLALDVNLHLSTAGGALDERVQTTLEATDPNFAGLQTLYLPIDSLQGSFSAQISVEPGYQFSGPPRLWLSLTLSEAGAVGKLVLVTLVDNGRSQAGSVPKIARFPEDTDLCQDGMYLAAPDHSADGVSRDAVLQQLNAASPALLDGGPATMSLEYTAVGSRACVQPHLGASPTSVWFPATARLRSSDGRVDGSIQATLWGDADSGSLHSRAAALSQLSDRASAAATAPSYALVDPIDFSSFDGGRFEFQDEVTVASDSGSLIVYGLDAAECSAVTLSNPGYGTSCTSASQTELWGARWSQR